MVSWFVANVYFCCVVCCVCVCFFFLQAEDGIRDLVRSRGLGDVYKRQAEYLGFGRHGELELGCKGSVWKKDECLSLYFRNHGR